MGGKEWVAGCVESAWDARAVGDEAQVVEEVSAVAPISEERFEAGEDATRNVRARGEVDKGSRLYAADNGRAFGNAVADLEAMGGKTGEDSAIRWANLSSQGT